MAELLHDLKAKSITCDYMRIRSLPLHQDMGSSLDRKSTRLNSSHRT